LTLERQNLELGVDPFLTQIPNVTAQYSFDLDNDINLK